MSKSNLTTTLTAAILALVPFHAALGSSPNDLPGPAVLPLVVAGVVGAIALSLKKK